MNADLDPIIGKIKKCLSLSQSDNPHEAASALRQAQALMRKHGLDEVAMANAEVGEAFVDATSTNATRPPYWEALLVTLVGQSFGCRPIVMKGARQPNGRRSKASFRYIGLTANALTAAYTLTVLMRQLRNSRNQHVSAFRAEAKSERWQPTAAEERSAGDAFCIGWLDSVRRLVTNFANPETVESAITRRCTDITQGRKASTTKTRIGSFDQGSIQAGTEAAKAVALHRPVNQPGGVPALGYQASF